MPDIHIHIANVDNKTKAVKKELEKLVRDGDLTAAVDFHEYVNTQIPEGVPNVTESDGADHLVFFSSKKNRRGQNAYACYISETGCKVEKFKNKWRLCADIEKLFICMERPVCSHSCFIRGVRRVIPNGIGFTRGLGCSETGYTDSCMDILSRPVGSVTYQDGRSNTEVKLYRSALIFILGLHALLIRGFNLCSVFTRGISSFSINRYNTLRGYKEKYNYLIIELFKLCCSNISKISFEDWYKLIYILPKANGDDAF